MAKKPKREEPNGVKTGAKKAMWAASAVGVITAAVIGVNQAAPVIEPYWYASREYVRDSIKEIKTIIASDQQETNRILRSMQVEQAEGKLEATRDSIAKWQIERSKTADPVSQGMIDQHIKTLQGSEGRLRDQLETLRRIRSPN